MATKLYYTNHLTGPTQYNTYNMFTVNGVTSDEYFDIVRASNRDAIGKAATMFWGAKHATVNGISQEYAAFMGYANTSSGNFSHVFNEALEMNALPTLYDTSNVLYGGQTIAAANSLGAWEKWTNLLDPTKGITGDVLTFDTETYGDAITRGRRSRGVYGMFELGLSNVHYENGAIVNGSGMLSDLATAQRIATTDVGSYTETVMFGIRKDSKAHSYILKAMDLYNKSGIEKLDPSQLATLKWLSKYRDVDINNGIQKITGNTLLDDLDLYTAKGMADFDLSPTSLQKGLEVNLKIGSMYDGRSNASVIADILSKTGIVDYDGSQWSLGQKYFGDNATSLISGANPLFDIDELIHELRGGDDREQALANMLAKNKYTMLHQTADTLSFVKGIAASQGETLAEFTSRYGIAAANGGSVEELLPAMGFSNIAQLHIGGPDAFNEIFLGDAMARIALNNPELMRKLEATRSTSLIENPAEQVFYFHRGGLNLREGYDFAHIATSEGLVPSQSYSYSHRAFTIDPEHSGWTNLENFIVNDKGEIVPNSERKYVLTFKDYVDKTEKHYGNKGTSGFTMVGDSMEDIADRLMRESMVLSKNNPKFRELTEGSRDLARMDAARREWERMTKPIGTTYGKANGADYASGGFNQLKKFIALYNESNGAFRPETIFERNLGDISFYDATAYPLLAEKFSTQQHLVQGIVEQIEEANFIGHDVDKNVARTIAFSEAYDAATKSIADYITGHGGKLEVQGMPSVQGSNNIDLLVANEIVRADASSIESLRHRLTGIFSSHDSSEVISILDDLTSRHMLSYDAANDFIEGYVSNVNFDIANNLGTITTELFNNRKTANSALDHGLDVHNASLWAMKFDLNGKSITIDELMDQDRDFGVQLSNIIQTSISETSERLRGITKIDKNNINRVVQEISGIAGYSSDENQQIIKEIFTGHNETSPYGLMNRAGWSTAVLTNEEAGTAFVFHMPNENMGRFREMALNNELDLSSYSKLTKNSDILEYAGVIEIPHIDTYDIMGQEPPKWMNKLGLGKMRIARMSDNQGVFVMPVMSTYVEDGQLHTRFTEGGDDIISYFRRGFGMNKRYLDSRDFASWSSSMRKLEFSEYSERSGSSSYITNTRFSDIPSRYMEFGTSDYLQANRVKIGNAINDIMKYSIDHNGDVEDIELEYALNIIGRATKYKGNLKDPASYAKGLLDNNNFEEYFYKHSFIPFGADSVVQNYLKSEEFLRDSNAQEYWNALEKALKKRGTTFDDTNFIEMINNAVQNGSAGKNPIFHESTANALGDLLSTIEDAHTQDFGGFGHYSQSVDMVSSQSAIQAGIFGIGANIADYNDAVALSNNMRPLAQNAAHARRIARQTLENLPEDIKYLGTAPVLSQGEIAATSNLAKNIRSRNASFADFLEGSTTLFSTTIKNVNQHELGGMFSKLMGQGSYDEFAARYGKEGIESLAKFQQAMEAFQGTYGTTHEDSSLMRPAIADFFDNTLPPEAKRFQLRSPESMDMERTSAMLMKLTENGDAVINRKTAIGINKNGKAVGADIDTDMILTRANVEQLLEEGRTYLEFANNGRDVSGRKIIFGTHEKTVARSIAVNKFADILGIEDLAVARNLANNMFSYVFGEETGFVATTGSVKHGAAIGSQSLFNTISDTFIKAGQGEQFANFLNNPDLFGKVSVDINGRQLSDLFSFDTTQNAILTRLGRVKNPNALYDAIYRSLDEGASLRLLDLNTVRDAQSRWDRYSQNNSTFITVQIPNINEVLGRRMTVDQRMEQAWALGFGGTHVGKIEDETYREIPIEERIHSEELGRRYRDMMRKYSQEYDPGQQETSSAINAYFGGLEAYLNQSRFRQGAYNEQRAGNLIAGFNNFIDAYNNPVELGSERAKQYVQLSINDIIEDKIFIPHGSENSYDNMMKSPFVVRGEYSELLRSKVGGDVNTLKAKRGIIFDLGEEVTVGKNKTRSLVVPFAELFETDAEGNYFATGTAGSLSRLLNTIASIKSGGASDKGTQAERMSDAIEKYAKEMAHHMSARDKKSEAYQIFNEYVQPTSTELLGLSEQAPLLEALNTEEFNNARKIVQDFTNKVSTDGLDSATQEEVLAYAKAMATMSAEAYKVAYSLRSDSSYYSPVAGVTNQYVARALDAGNGNYGYVATVSREALQRSGLDFAVLSKDVLEAYETEGGLAAKSLDFSDVFTDAEFKAWKEEFVAEFNKNNNGNILYEIEQAIDNVKENGQPLTEKVKITSLDPTKPLFGEQGQITQTLRAQYGTSDFGEIAKKVNASIAANEGESSPVWAFYNAFGVSNAGEEYMKRVGTFADFKRFPIFKNQPVGRILMEDTLERGTARLWSHLFSYETNIDFDGDKAMLAMVLDGASVLKRNSENYQIMSDVYNDFITHYSREGMAQGLEDLDFIKYENLNNRRAQQASLLQLLNPDAYEDVKVNFVSKNASAFNTIKEYFEEQLNEKRGKNLFSEKTTKNLVGKIQDFLLANSQEVNDAFMALPANTMYDVNMVLESTAAKIRNKGIGYASTPNYKERDVFITMTNALDMIEDTTKRETLKTKLYDVKGTMFDMFSKRGGMMAVVEQDIISAKGAKSGLSVGEQALYEEGMRELANIYDRSLIGTQFNQARFERHVGTAVNDILLGAGTGVYNITAETAAGYGALASMYNYDDLRAMLKTVENGGELSVDISSVFNEAKGSRMFRLNDADTLRDVVAIRGTAELHVDEDMIKTNMNIVRDLFGKNESIGKIAEEFEAALGLENAEQLTSGGYAGNILRYFVKSQRQIEEAEASRYAGDFLQKNNVYFMAGDLGNESAAFMYRGNDDFVRLDSIENPSLSDLSKAKGSSVTDEEFARMLNRNNGYEPIQIGEYLQNPHGTLDNYMQQAEMQRRVNVADQLSDMMTRGQNIGNLQAVNPSEEVAQIVETYRRGSAEDVQNMMNAYTLLNDSMKKGQGGIYSLIRDINKDIADHPERYSQTSFSEALQQGIYDNVYNQNAFNKYLDASRSLSANDIASVNEAIEKVQANRYNIEEQTTGFNKFFKDINAQFESAKKNGATQGSIDSAASIIDSAEGKFNRIISGLDQQSQQAVADAEALVYKIIGSDANADAKLSALFGYGIEAGNANKVAFGKYMGVRFDELGMPDINEILTSADALLQQDMSAAKRSAVLATKEALENFKANAAIKPVNSWMGGAISPEVEALKEQLNRSILDMKTSPEDAWARQNMINQMQKDAVEASKQESKEMMRKTLSDAKESIMNSKVLQYGGAIGLLALAGSMLHKKSGSPLTPKEKNKEKEPGYINNGTLQYGKIDENNIYVDRKSGLKFDVSARTRSKMQAMNAQQFQQYGGGRVHNINITQDKSTIDQNWLENRFAELTE